jgi:hypothetical protein
MKKAKKQRESSASKASLDMEALIRQLGDRAIRRLEDEVRRQGKQAGKRSSGKRK